MKKIKLNSAKLILKKDVIGNLTTSEMQNVQGGGETGYAYCNNFTIEGFTCNTRDAACGPFGTAVGCDSNNGCGGPPDPNYTRESCVITGPTCPFF